MPEPCAPLLYGRRSPRRGSAIRTQWSVVRVSLSPVPELGYFLSFFFPLFFGLTARVIPLRSGLRVFCFLGTSFESLGTLQQCIPSPYRFSESQGFASSFRFKSH